MDYESAYLTLRDAVTSIMDNSELESWNATLGIPEESRLELLIEYIKRQKLQTLDEGSIQLHELMQSYERAGFTHADAMDLTKHTMTTHIQAWVFGQNGNAS